MVCVVGTNYSINYICPFRKTHFDPIMLEKIHLMFSLELRNQAFHQEKVQHFQTPEVLEPSSETQGQIVGVRESLNGRKNMARRRTARRAPGDNVLPDQFQTVAAVLSSDWAEKQKSFLAPIRRQNGGDRLELVW